MLKASPQLIVDFGSTGATYVSLADRVQSQTGIPYVLIDGRKTGQDYFYAHLIAPPPVDRRERVRTGQYVGRVGKTGNAASTPCHLHFEIRVHGRPVDPEPYLHDWDKHS